MLTFKLLVKMYFDAICTNFYLNFDHVAVTDPVFPIPGGAPTPKMGLIFGKIFPKVA